MKKKRLELKRLTVNVLSQVRGGALNVSGDSACLACEASLASRCERCSNSCNTCMSCACL